MFERQKRDYSVSQCQFGSGIGLGAILIQRELIVLAASGTLNGFADFHNGLIAWAVCKLAGAHAQIIHLGIVAPGFGSNACLGRLGLWGSKAARHSRPQSGPDM